MANDQAALTKQVKEANDIVAVVGSYVALRPAGQTFKGLCPFHKDSRPSFQVDPKWQNYRCWSCGKRGDVITFVMEHDRISFPEARALLARRAGIVLPGDDGPDPGRLRLLDALRWAAERFQECLLDSPLAESARRYLGERHLVGEVVRKFGLGFAPLDGQWLVRQAAHGGPDLETLVEVGLLGRREHGAGCYDRFRDRVMFPVRSVGGQLVGFGGRILPESAYASRAPKYYNSPETALFSKSELLYGLDQAKFAAAQAGCLAVVEGYTDVLMAHQHGVPQVVATMGTALTAQHVRQLRRFVPRVVLVFDADTGGLTGVDRALEIFVSQDVELAIATLPAGLDPCDLLTQQGAEPFKLALTNAVDALDFKLNQVLAREEGRGVEGQRRAVEAVLGIMALAPKAATQAALVKEELIVSRITHWPSLRALRLREETVWARLRELRANRQRREAEQAGRQAPAGVETSGEPPRTAPAAPEERELLEVLLAEPALVPVAWEQLKSSEVNHPGLRRMLEGLYALHEAGDPPDLDGLRVKLEHQRLAQKALELQEIGRANPDRAAWLQRLLAAFRQRHALSEKQRLQGELSATTDPAAAIELLRQLQNQTAGTEIP